MFINFEVRLLTGCFYLSSPFQNLSLPPNVDPSTSDDSGRASERLTASSVAQRDPDSSRDRLSDASSRCSSGKGYICDSEGDDDKVSCCYFAVQEVINYRHLLETSRGQSSSRGGKTFYNSCLLMMMRGLLFLHFI